MAGPMVDWTLVGVAAGTAVAAAFFIAAANAFHRAASYGGTAARAFTFWWTGVAGYALVGMTINLWAAFAVPPLWAYVALRLLMLTVANVAIAALVHYFAYLFLGRRGLLPVIAAYYSMTLTAMIALLLWQRPESVRIGTWRTDMVLAAPDPLLFNAFVLLLLAPPILGAAAYATLAIRLDDKQRRHRAMLVSGGMGIWLVAVAVSRWMAHDLAHVAANVGGGILAASAVLLAYRLPPLRQSGEPAASTIMQRARDLI